VHFTAGENLADHVADLVADAIGTVALRHI
jgi:hypothetical protein